MTRFPNSAPRSLLVASALVVGCGFAGCGLAGCGARPQAPANSETPIAADQTPKKTPEDLLAEGQRALSRGDLVQAESLLSQAEKKRPGSARLALAELSLLRGNTEAALSLLEADPSVSSALLQAQAHVSRGRIDEALTLVSDRPQAAPLSRQRLALQRAELLIVLGKRDEARPALLSVIAATDEVNAGAKDGSPASLVRVSETWTSAGQAAQLLRKAELANDCFNRAELAGGKSLRLYLARFWLYLETHDEAHADEMLSELAKIAPRRPEVLDARARFALEASLDFSFAEETAHQLLRINPHDQNARALLAGLALRDMDFETAQLNVQRILKRNPRQLEALSLQATARFLAEDPQGFEQTVEQTLAFSPGHAALFSTVAHYAEWEHRYPDIERLLRRASRLDRDDARVRAQLGLTLVRSGSDAAGVVELGRAYELDPFDVRVVNTLNLYEKIIPRDYVEFRQGPFLYRVPKKDEQLLKRYVPALLEDAYAKMVQRYEYTPLAPIYIEIYADREAFAVRTSGLPRTAIAGVCFGRKLATVSPSGGQGNLGMTLWHELAHVFHIGLSNHRVPRWFTEGLAEWETKVRGVGWSRELDRELSITARAGNLPPLSRLSRAFTHAESHQDIASAYYASGLIAEWTVDSQGQSKVVSVLRELGQKRLFTDVFPEQLGQSWAQLDGEVEEFFQAHLSAMNAQFVSQTPTLSSPQLERALKKSPDDRQLRLMRAQYLLAAGQVQAAHEMLTRLDAVNYDAQVSFSLARIALSEKRFADVDRRLSKMVAHGDDGYEVRLAWGSSLMLQKKATQAISQLQKAAHFDPGATEPLQLLSRLFAERSHQEQELVVVHRLAQLSEHEPGPHRRLMELLLEAKREKEAAQAAELAIWVDLADSSLHRLAGQSFARAGDLSRAQFEWESALLTVKSAGELRDLGEVWQAELVRVGRNKEARDVAARIEKTLSQ